MAIELKQSLTLAQQLIMTPQLQQAIKLLQLSRMELVETITQEMEANPVLEEFGQEEYEEDTKAAPDKDETDTESSGLSEVTVEERVGDDIDWESYIEEYNTRPIETPYEKRDALPLENITAVKTNLYSHLMWQLNVSDLKDDQKFIGTHIIGNLDKNGYLDTSIEEISQTTGARPEEVVEILRFIQNLDPVGVAARDARESLLIQAKAQNLDGTIVEKIISNHLGDLENRRYNKIAKELDVLPDDIFAAVTIIQGLEPRPGRLYSDEEPIYITPDVYIFKVGDDYEIMLNLDGMPRLRINSYYKNMLRNKDSLPESTRNYIHEKLKSAAWLIKSIHQRQRTIYKVTESIVRFQRDFLDNGITHLKPLVLRDVAEDIEMHESTVSRVTSNKYVHTPQGIFELKFFFNSSISGLQGTTFASESVREHIRNIIKLEDKAKPYSDQEIVDILRKIDIKVARRTVAKYRESMGILPSRKRKDPY